MTLTEEQLAALKRVAAYMDEMYSVASPYHGCTEDANLLRAMIDSSEHVTDHTKMIGFDLERARGLRDFLQDDCAEVGDVWGEMIAEIERLRGFETAARDLSNDLTRVAKERDELQEANTNFAFQASDQAQEIERLRAENLELQGEVFGPDGIRANQACIIADQAASISELEIEITELKADLEQSERVIEDRLDVIEAQAIQIKALEDALAEYQRLGKIISESVIPCLTVHGNCDQCRPKTKAACEAIAAIHKGKIGPDAETGNRDHVVGPDQMVPNGKVWQITEERKAALSAMSSLRTDVDCPQCDAWLHFSDIAKHASVLRAMLREAA